MEGVLIVSSSAKGRDALRRMGGQEERALLASSGGEARRMLGHGSLELIVINAPLSDEPGQELALAAVESTTAGVLLLAPLEQYEAMCSALVERGVLVLQKPLNRALYHQAVGLALSARARMLGLTRENVRLKDKLEEVKLVGRAKSVLMNKLGMTEQQAHRLIEKQAMDMRLTKAHVATTIIRTYE